MLLIGILGDVGAGKTSLLLSLAEWWRAQGKEPEGFVAIAGERSERTRGAASYELLMVKDRRRLPYARRDNSSHPPYRFDDATVAALGRWADGLAAHTSPSLVILDEFGPREAAGEGHLSLWARVLQANAEIVVVAVRKGLEREMENRIGGKFEVLVEAGGDDAWESLRQACLEHSDWMRVGLYGGGAGGFEASVGSILHGTQIPLRGLFLSSMQSVIMTYAADGMGQRMRVVWVAVIAAALKALSPAGNRVRPMLAITVQGVMYALAVTLLGWNMISVAAGGFLVGAWSALQGVALQYLFVGNELLRAYDTIIQWMASKLNLHAIGFLQLVVGWTILCGAVSSTLTLMAWKRRRHMPGRLSDLVFRKQARIALDRGPVSVTGALRRGLKDVTRPLFWLPVLIVIGVMFASGSSLDDMVWIVFRAAVVGFVLFSIVRSFDLHRIIAWLRLHGHWGPALALQNAMERLNPTNTPSSDSKERSSSIP
jgi:nucleoside-triphosphatase THEP1